MTDSKYFTTNKKGEIFELKAELNNEKKEKRKEAVKKVIAAMTVGKDVSSLFPDVVNCMQTDNLELKKLVYLYLMNYAKSQPDMAIMAVNSFVKDCEDPNPLIRALAVRTMGCIRVDKITEYLCEPLRKCLKDEDPYVRKTAAVCVAKLHDINAQMVEDQGFLDSLRDLIADSNPMQSAERCVSTLLDLIQTKVNYVVQEAIVVIRDIFRKYPNKYESIIATLCENLDSLDEPDARAAMIWIVGEYAERIDNADELLESFLEGFHDESTQVQLTLLTAIVKLFLKKPSETQELVQQVLSLATQDSDNPDLRDRGYIYWRLLSTDPVTAKEVVLSEKPLISEETDLIEPTLLDELICHIGSLASVYHKPPNAFVEGSHGIHRKHLPIHHGSTDAGDSPVGTTTAANLEQPQVIPSQGDLLGDLLNLDLGPPVNVPQVSSMQVGAVDLLGGGLDSLLGSDLGGGIGGSPAVGQSFIPSSVPAAFAPSPTPAVVSSGLNDLFELSTGMGMAPGGHVAPKAVWLPAVKAKGLEISGTFTHRQGHIYMEMSFTNKALQHMTDFAIQFNKNSFGVIPSTPLAIHTPLMPNQSIDVSLPLNTLGPVMKMEPLNNLQVAVKNNIDVFYFSCLIPLNVLFVEDGKMERQVFLATWKDIPNENELQFQIKECHLNADTVSSKLQNNNVYTIAKRNVEGQDMLYQSLKLTNGIWILAELRIQPGNPNYTLSLKCRAPEVSQYIYQVYDSILKN
ncbi:adaptor related protein complex 2 subunit beta 1 [Phyllostomus discolor]|uniref:Adaptor related protein complex 2 subunit beta 1 n=1 Tax=Phyllostomus discolor TaxID=89673 RepID=A0A833ZIU3_9CHIR|nr:adaptor related protein complex 2 subunit beta 1 [Phyllostomus discolor]